MYPTIDPDEINKAHANDIIDAVSNASEAKPLVAALARAHRTNQQSLTRVMVEWITYLADLKHGEYDPRNEASVKLAKRMVRIPDWERLKYLPYI